MSRTLEEIEKELLELSVEDRAVLRDRLDASLHEMAPENKKVWVVEAERRWEEIKSGKVKTIPRKQVMEDLRAELNAHRH